MWGSRSRGSDRECVLPRTRRRILPRPVAANHRLSFFAQSLRRSTRKILLDPPLRW